MGIISKAVAVGSNARLNLISTDHNDSNLKSIEIVYNRMMYSPFCFIEALSLNFEVFCRNPLGPPKIKKVEKNGLNAEQFK